MAEAAARLHDPIQHTRARSMLIVGAVVGGVVAGAFAIATAPVSIPVLLGTAGLGIATGAGMGELAGHFSFMKVVTGEIAIPGSPNVFINGRPAARAHLDMVDCRWHPAHPPVAQGSSNVFINGLPAARKGDRTTCDAVILEGSPNVFIGGGTATTDTISPEVSDRMHKTVQLIGLCSAAVLFGPAVALIGWYASEPIGKTVHNLTGKAFGEGTNSQIAAELALSGLMAGMGARSALRGGRPGAMESTALLENTPVKITAPVKSTMMPEEVGPPAAVANASSEFVTVFRGDAAGTSIIKSNAAKEGGYASSQQIIENNSLDDLFKAHAKDSQAPPSPFISVTTDPDVARYFAGPNGVVNEFRIPASRATPNPFNNYLVPAGTGGQLVPEAEFLVPNYIRPSEFVRKP